jgi:outer membrane protein OmpA-like peptidoglycan-associated protein
MLLRIFLSVFLISALSGLANAGERRFIASMEDSRWELTSNSPVFCRIEHNIPRFGTAIFSQAAGRGLKLQLISKRKFRKGMKVELRSESGGWKPVESIETLARLQTTGRKNSLQIPGLVAELSFSELNEGFQPGFLFQGDNPLIASMSAVRFRDVANQFNQCVDQLYHENFDDIRLDHIHFDSNEEFPRLAEEKSAFHKMFAYLQVDNTISEIVITGHADMRGNSCHNEKLSEHRAWYVYDLLISKGFDSNLIRVDYAGDDKPAKKGKSKAVLAANRRVTVELHR